MKVYLVSYDLNYEGQNYRKLIDAIDSAYINIKVLKSQHLVCSNATAREIFTYLLKFVDSNDDLLVCELTENHAENFNTNIKNWIIKAMNYQPLLPNLGSRHFS